MSCTVTRSSNRMPLTLRRPQRRRRRAIDVRESVTWGNTVSTSCTVSPGQRRNGPFGTSRNWLQALRSTRRCRLTLNFHPDRPLHGTPILDAMAEDGVYRSRFVTGTSNGGLTAHPAFGSWLKTPDVTPATPRSGIRRLGHADCGR
ncbi:DUF3626 domain-containing protein [Streptomyces sp. NPDC059999]|uniref:DUF3626 domain-containing protein n=1 Tax=Streptomyces sp. NPDC059999 TaxID=3347030 RepID=UPI0036988869